MCPEVTIVTRAHLAEIPADMAEIAQPLVGDCLSCQTREFSADSTGIQSRLVTHRFYTIDNDGPLIQFSAGLVPRLARHLLQQGLAVDIHHETCWTDLERLRSVQTGKHEQDLIQTVCGNPCGQILVTGVRQANERIASLCRVIPSGRTLVVAGNNKRAKAIFEYLKNAGLSQPVVKSNDRQPECCIGVCTLDKYPANPYWNIAIFDGVETVLAKQVYELAPRNAVQLKYCVRYQTGRSLSRCELLMLESICGPVIHPEPVPAQSVAVAFARAPFLHVPSNLAPRQRKHQTIWHHAARNQAIANIAQSLADFDIAALYEHGLFLDLREHVPAEMLSDQTVSILVESSEHALNLKELLPGWTVLTYLPDASGAVETSYTTDRSIVTETYANQIGIDTAIIIRATGTESPLLVKNWPADGQPAHVIDLADDFDDQATYETSMRIADYQSQGWSVSASRYLLPSNRSRIKKPAGEDRSRA